jgi:replicative DNA helicase
MKNLAREIIESNGETPEELAAKMQKCIDDMQNQVDCFEITSIQETVNSTLDLIETRIKNGQKCIGIPSGINGIDRLISGFQPRRLYYIGARPSQGKTALLLNCVRNCKEACGIISAESAKEELVMRLLASKSHIDSQRLVVGLVKEGEMKQLTEAASALYESNGIYIYDESNMSIDTVVMIARQMKRKFDIKILYVDYLQCLSPSKAMGKQEYREQVAYASKQLKQLARVLNIPVVVAAQLRRDAEGNRPMLSDFSDSTQIERDADVAIMIHNIYSNGNLEDTWLLVEKNRDGRTGDIHVEFDQAHMSFYDK